MKRLFFVLPFLLAGCSAPQSDQTLAPVAPHPVVVATIPPMPVGTVVGTASTLSAPLTAPALEAQPFTAQEQAWMDNAHKAFDMLPGAPSPSDSASTRVALLKAGLAQSKAQYEQFRASVRLLKADSLFRDGYSEAEQAVVLLESGNSTQSRDTLEQSRQAFSDSHDLFNKAFNELQLIVNELRGTPRPK